MTYKLLRHFIRQLMHYATKALEKQRDPYAEIAQLLAQIRQYPTVHHQHLLVQRLIEIESYGEALERINLILVNQYADCSQLLFDKAKILFALNQLQAAQNILDGLIVRHGQQYDYCLLYARVLSKLNYRREANHWFEISEMLCHDLEASYYYLEHLKQFHDPARIHAVFIKMQRRYAQLPRHYQKLAKNWIKQAKV